MRRLLSSLVAFLASTAIVYAATSTIDPNYPADGDEIEAAPLRGQFQAAKSDIEAIYEQINPAIGANELLGTLAPGAPYGIAFPDCWQDNDAITWKAGIGPGCHSIAGSGDSTPSVADGNTIYAGPADGSEGAVLFRSLVGADLPSPSSSTLGGVKSLTRSTHNFLTGISTSGTPQQAQPDFSDLTGQISPSQYLAATATMLGAVQPDGTTTTVLNGVITSIGGALTGTAGGDLAGTYPNPTVASLANVTTGILPMVNGGTGQIQGIVFNSTGAASANTSAIQAALTAGGKVTLNCPTSSPRFYTNGTVYIGSHTTFLLGNCIWTTAANMNRPLIANGAYNRSWSYFNAGTSNITWHVNPPGISGNNLAATLRWPGHSLSVGDWVQLSLAPDNPKWATSTRYDTGIAAVANGNRYVVTTGGTSASSGSGPSGTASSISDGSVVWQYQSSFGGTAAFWWSGTKTAGTQGGPADTAYGGIFYVASVTDANNVVIILRRQPSASFTGVPIMVRKADHDIEFSGGNSILDGNASQQSGTGSQPGRVVMMLSGIARTKWHDFQILNTPLWSISVQGASEYLLDRYDLSPESGILGTDTGSQFISYGCFDCTISNVGGVAYDDSIAAQTSNCEVGVHPDDLAWPGSDLLGLHVSHIQNSAGYNGVAIWGLHNSFYMDDITIDHMRPHVSQASFSALRLQQATFVGACFASAGSASQVGTIRVSDSESRDANSVLVKAWSGDGNWNIKNLILDNVMAGKNSNTGQVVQISPPSGFTYTVENIIVRNSNITLDSSTDSMIQLNGNGGTLNAPNITAMNNNITGASAGNGYVVNAAASGTGNLGVINLSNNKLNNLAALYNGNDAVKLNIRDNNGTGSSYAGVIANVAGISASFCGNSFSGASGGLFSFGAVVSGTVYSCGDNLLTGGATWFGFPSAGTPSAYGWDIQCDVTKLARTTGEYCSNTNTSPGSGTLNTAGPVMNQGPSSGSWFLMANPAGQTY